MSNKKIIVGLGIFVLLSTSYNNCSRVGILNNVPAFQNPTILQGTTTTGNPDGTTTTGNPALYKFSRVKGFALGTDYAGRLICKFIHKCYFNISEDQCHADFPSVAPDFQEMVDKEFNDNLISDFEQATKYGGLAIGIRTCPDTNLQVKELGEIQSLVADLIDGMELDKYVFTAEDFYSPIVRGMGGRTIRSQWVRDGYEGAAVRISVLSPGQPAIITNFRYIKRLPVFRNTSYSISFLYQRETGNQNIAIALNLINENNKPFLLQSGTTSHETFGSWVKLTRVFDIPAEVQGNTFKLDTSLTLVGEGDLRLDSVELNEGSKSENLFENGHFEENPYFNWSFQNMGY